MTDEHPLLGPKRLQLSAEARDDLRELEEYLRTERGDQIATNFLIRLDADLRSLATSGHPGASRGSLSPGLRLHVFERFSIYFRLTSDAVRIVHIFRGSRDLTQIDFSPDE